MKNNSNSLIEESYNIKNYIYTNPKRLKRHEHVV